MARLPALLDRGSAAELNVAIVCPYAWDRFGGVQSHVRALARALEARGHTIGVLAPQSSGQVGESPDGVTFVGRALSVPANGSMAPVGKSVV